MKIEYQKIDTTEQRAQLVNQLLEDHSLADLQGILDSLEVEEHCLASKVEALQSSLAQSTPSILLRTEGLFGLHSDSCISTELQNLEKELESLSHLKDLDEHFKRMRLFGEYSQMTAKFINFKEALQDKSLLEMGNEQFLKFIDDHVYFFEQLRKADHPEVHLDLFEDKIKQCYKEVLGQFEKNSNQTDTSVYKSILQKWPLPNQNSILKTKVLSLCLKDFPDKSLRIDNYVLFISKIKDALYFLKSLEPVLECDLMTVNSLLVSLKSYDFEMSEFESLEPLDEFQDLFQSTF